jgi:hypothetical protein
MFIFKLKMKIKKETKALYLCMEEADEEDEILYTKGDVIMNVSEQMIYWKREGYKIPDEFICKGRR